MLKHSEGPTIDRADRNYNAMKKGMVLVSFPTSLRINFPCTILYWYI